MWLPRELNWKDAEIGSRDWIETSFWFGPRGAWCIKHSINTQYWTSSCSDGVKTSCQPTHIKLRFERWLLHSSLDLDYTERYQLRRCSFSILSLFFLRCDLELEINSEKDIAPVSRLISASQYPRVNAIIGLVLRQNIEKLTHKI